MIDLNKIIKDLGRIHTQEKLIIFGLLFFSFLIGFGGAILLGKSYININISTGSKLAPTPVPLPVALSLNTSANSIVKGTNFDVDIIINSPDSGVDAADFILYFDPSIVKPLSIKPGNFFHQLPLQKIDKNFIKISAVASYLNNKIIIPKGSGVVATITFKALSSANSSLIYFDPDKTIIATNGQNIVGALSSLNITIK